jgi:hypothetical protein
VSSPDAVAERAAGKLSAEMDPSIPARVARVLQSRATAGPAAKPARDGLAQFLVAAADAGCSLRAAIGGTVGESARFLLGRRLRREMGIDEGMSPDHDLVIDAVVDALISG